MTEHQIGQINSKLNDVCERLSAVETTLRTFTELRSENDAEEIRYRKRMDRECERRHAEDRRRIAKLEEQGQKVFGFSQRVIGGLIALTAGLSVVATLLSLVQLLWG